MFPVVIWNIIFSFSKCSVMNRLECILLEVGHFSCELPSDKQCEQYHSKSKNPLVFIRSTRFPDIEITFEWKNEIKPAISSSRDNFVEMMLSQQPAERCCTCLCRMRRFVFDLDELTQKIVKKKNLKCCFAHNNTVENFTKMFSQ